MLSMTGFGKADAVFDNNLQISIEVSSVNRKQFDLRVNMPSELSALETLVRSKLSAAVSRGTVQVKVALKNNASSGRTGSVKVDKELLLLLVQTCRDIRSECNLAPEVDVESLISAPGVIQYEMPDTAGSDFTACFAEVLENAVANYQRMRQTEGNALKVELQGRLEMLEDILSRIEPQVNHLPETVKERLLAKLAAEKIPVPATDEQLLKEILFYADKSDVTEEITRLKSHFAQFRGFFESKTPCGRSMDFLTQETFREITTLGNKTGSAGVSPLLVAFKNELEKMREQIQNVE